MKGCPVQHFSDMREKRELDISSHIGTMLSAEIGLQEVECDKSSIMSIIPGGH